MRQHPDDVTLLEYAAGALKDRMPATILDHLRNCGRCNALVAIGEALGGALLEAIPPARLSPRLHKHVQTWLWLHSALRPQA